MMMKQQLKQIIREFFAMIQIRVSNNWKPYFLTFTFRQLPGSQKAILYQMENQVERIYTTFVTHVIRNPRSVHIDRLPFLIAVPDMAEVAVPTNGGLHYHGILMVPAKTRLRETIEEHFSNKRYVNDHSRLDPIDVQPITSNLFKVVRYALKGIGNPLLPYDSVLVFPKSHTEINRKESRRR